ncbi:MAG: chitin deacetylase, partial [Rhodospirillales bacterium]|nr:chitin deacetylase [Rhodospirillales bacterium]
GLDRLNCFPSHGGKAKVERLGATRIEVRMDKALPPGRTRINCTLFVEKGRFRWFGTLFYLPKK